MNTHYKSLLVVMLLAGGALWLLRPVFAPLMLSASDYPRRCKLWLLITAVAFLAPGFWLYAACAALAITWAARRDTNPAALFPLLLLAVPPLEAAIPGVFGVHHQRWLILVLLLPMAYRLAREAHTPGVLQWPSDKVMAAYLVLLTVLYVPHLSVTAGLRYVLMLLLGTWLPYFVMSRAFKSEAQIRDAMACFVLSVMIMAAPAVAEARLSTLLYGSFFEHWDLPNIFGYLKRGDYLRAQLASGQPIVLAYQFAVAIGLWLVLQARVGSAFWRLAGSVALVAGLVVTFSRGPWVGAAAIFLVFIAIGPHGIGRSLKWIAISLVCVGAALMTPYGQQVANLLPFVGEAEQGSISYRQQIVEVSWTLIKRSPFFGDPYAKAQMESLRTGEGIIDIVNVYVAFALAYGMVGVTLFVGIFLSVMGPLWRRAKSALVPEDSRQLAASLLACLVGVLVMISAVSNYLTVPITYLMLLGLSAAYLHLPVAQHSLSDSPGFMPAGRLNAGPAAAPAKRW